MATLYRDYRPNKFSEVFGQNHIKIALQNEIASDRLAQAYLFCGPRAVGKTTLARILAKAANCTKRKPGESEPCGQCPNCLAITAGNSLDVIEIDAASNTGVDNVRDNIISSARVSAGQGKYRIFIIDEVHMLSLSAWNALLKTLEEPPQRVIFILCTTEIHKVPATIISRCERYDFHRITVAEITKKLQNIVSQEKATVDQEVLEAIARQADGHLRDAESLLGQVLSLGQGKITWSQAELVIPRYHHNEAVNLLELIAKNDAREALKLVSDLVDGGLNLKNFVGEAIAVLRQAMLDKVDPGLSHRLGLDLGDTLELKIMSLAESLSPDKIISFLEAFLEVYNDSRVSFVTQLPLEMKIVSLCCRDQIVNRTTSDQPLNDSAPRAAVTAPPKKAATATPIKNKKAAPDCPAATVLSKWPEFLVKIRNANYSLSFILQNCRTGCLTNGVLPLTFKYKFHQDRISDPAIRPIVENLLGEVFAGAVATELSVDENLDLSLVAASDANAVPVTSAAAEDPDNAGMADKTLKKADLNPKTETDNSSMLNNLLKTFGGEVIS